MFKNVARILFYSIVLLLLLGQISSSSVINLQHAFSKAFGVHAERLSPVHLDVNQAFLVK